MTTSHGADKDSPPPVTTDLPGSGLPGVPSKSSRSARLGRNLIAAIAVGVTMGAVILASLLIQRQAFVIVLAVAVAVATWELAGALRHSAQAIIVPLPVLLVGGQAMVWLAWPFGLTGSAIAFAVTVLVSLLWRMFAASPAANPASGFVRDVGAGVFTAAYVPFFVSFAVLLVLPEDGVGRVLTFMICVVASDVGGYAAGVLAGRHPMAPRISPKKSWEGFGGSLVAGMVAGALSVHLLLAGVWWQGAILGAVLVITATLGDLTESMIKRDLGIKDMGNLLPGHGGLMDRMDSMLPAAFVSWALLSAFVPV
ncbi:phosphatidate cytidylyltransferase [Pseudonocardia oroxyli]|uniref:Phosphatidate cytidylyltransferase n=1 Tax=Pseudonocardia oroxyli TaxID=366584 RepID=A0A1G7KF94_PSEOR|nr:phosphatidate cytidylyltransferase [Pseudonocardia oroxyli]SDF35815.1 phosphatidate cytidylyltransferase [Pseudonocardia oroxyli]